MSRQSPVRRARALLFPLGAALALAGCSDPPAPAAPEEGPAAAFADAHDELAIDLVDGSSLEALLARYPELRDRVRWNSPNVADEAIAVAKVPFAEQEALLARLRQDPLVEAAEHNGVFSLDPTLLSSQPSDLLPDDDRLPALGGYPNDPLYPKQWNMELVNARPAWRYARGEDVIVAVIDTGVAYETEKGLWAPDLRETRFVPGYDFVNDDEIAADDHGHGTHCAGTIAQSSHNGRGVIGLAPRCRIMPLKVLSEHGSGTAVDIADAIRFAADRGAHVLSLSLGGGGRSEVMADAVAYARDKGCVVVCAAGNGGRGVVEYPAAYPGAIAVSSVGPKGDLARYSSFGKQVFVAAPGGDKSLGVEAGVLQNTLDPRDRSHRTTVYAWWQGTSMATPHVAAAAALLRSVGVTRADAIESLLASTARGRGWNQKTGHGILDAGAAVHRAVFLPGWVSLALAGLLVGLAIKLSAPRHLPRGLLLAGGLLGSAGLFFLRPLGLGEVPLVGEFLVRGMPDWDIAIFGPGMHWHALFASALIPAVLAVVSIPIRPVRGLAVGLCLGWSARLLTGLLFSHADVLYIPGQGIADSVWLLGNALVLLPVAAVVARLGRGRDERVAL